VRQCEPHGCTVQVEAPEILSETVPAGSRRTAHGTMRAFTRDMDSVHYVEIGLWVLNIIIYASCLWLWLRPESD
jgi:hypothetical protein